MYNTFRESYTLKLTFSKIVQFMRLDSFVKRVIQLDTALFREHVP